ncbi:hypothetical protein HBI49_136880 [Parastagonospora nodorum]|nr:hypothetical protein HBI74_195070 [Parastagonospora nodorum]KAH5117874.1 hypothetical protein HBH71_103170 [Parastagonospora nodorum]KAH5345245.1 hypothetical protein HBI48_202940 [Parastagonospora nodorum]KAH5359672.1 hypothetical protein HBI49_136880 [Parastagonospora nodorum]KAH5384594.1 hypothetical protein HBI33_104580 [Parastagonospora nodorum]
MPCSVSFALPALNPMSHFLHQLGPHISLSLWSSVFEKDTLSIRTLKAYRTEPIRYHKLSLFTTHQVLPAIIFIVFLLSRKRHAAGAHLIFEPQNFSHPYQLLWETFGKCENEELTYLRRATSGAFISQVKTRVFAEAEHGFHV